MFILSVCLQDLKAFERFHCTVLQQICYYGCYQDLEEGITCESEQNKLLVAIVGSPSTQTKSYAWSKLLGLFTNFI